MKFRASVSDLHSGLAACAHALSTKGSLPVLSFILLEAHEGALSLSATNLELAVTTNIPAEVEKEGSVCAPGRLLTELVSSLESQELTVSVKDNSLDVESPNVKSRLNGIAASEFPRLAMGVTGEALLLPPEEFCAALPSIVMSSANDESRPVLTGVLFDARDDVLTLVGVDGFRLSEKKIVLQQKSVKVLRAIIPARALSEVGRLVANEESLSVYLDDGENQIIFKSPKFQISSRLIEGSFPEYQKIIPASFITKATISLEELRKGVKLASLFARDSSNVIKISLGPSESVVVLGANTPEIGESETRLSAQIEGEAVSVAFNNRYLSDCLSHISGPEVVFQASGQLSPGLFTANKDDGYFHIIMPVRVQE